EALAPGSARRRALDAAVAEMEKGAVTPSIEWRRQFSLLLGLERLLSEEEPHLADGTVLSAHQVDALSGTLTALLAEAQRYGTGAAKARAHPPIAGAQEPEYDDEDRPPRATLTDDEDEDDDLLDDDEDEDDDDEDDEDDDVDEVVDEVDEDDDEGEPELDDRA